MSEPRLLTDAQLAAIRAGQKSLNYYEVVELLDHSAALAARVAAAEQTIAERVATIHALMMIIDAHEADMEELGQRCDKALDDLAAAQATIERQRSRMGDLWGTLDEHQWGCRCEGDELCPACGFSRRTKEGQHATSCDIARALAPPAPEAAS